MILTVDTVLILSAVAAAFQAWWGVCILIFIQSGFKFFYAGFEDFILLFQQSILFLKSLDDFNLVVTHLLSTQAIRVSLRVYKALWLRLM